ncbi:Proteasome assembly chaperone 2, variant 2 [Homalodisca vitripennis]|nr:Proteasome assembly chaperone 2, variant 2 [Homalodisca vitripennis]
MNNPSYPASVLPHLGLSGHFPEANIEIYLPRLADAQLHALVSHDSCSKEEEFLNHLVKWFEQLEADKVIILSSLYDYERNDNQIVEPHVRCCVCPLTQSLYQSVFRSLNCRYMEVKDDADKTGIMSPSMYLPGAGFTQNLHLKWFVICSHMYK